MRSQIITPVLCFLFTIFFSFNSVYSAININRNISKAAENKEVNVLKMDSYYINSPIFSQLKNTSKQIVKNTTINSKPNVVYKAEKTLIGENSYKINDKRSAENATITKISKEDILSKQDFFQKGMFYGFTLMVILLNIVCFFLFEEKIFLYYTFAITSIAVTFMYSDSLFPFIGINGIENMAVMQSTLLLIATTFSAFFASKYLTLEEFFPKLKWITFSLISFAFMMVFSEWVLEVTIFTGITNTILISVMFLYFTAGVVLFNKKNYAKFYVIAYSIPVLFAIDFFVLKSLGIGFLFTDSFHLKAATIIEILLITYAIMYRMRAIKEEHLMRQTEMRIFFKRQEVINRTSTEKLMQDIYLENLIMQYDLDGLEIKLLQYISEGKDNVKIARKLKTTELEVEMLTKGLYNKLEIGEQIQEDFTMIETQPDYIYN